MGLNIRSNDTIFAPIVFTLCVYVLSQKAGRPRLFRAGMEAVNFPY